MIEKTDVKITHAIVPTGVSISPIIPTAEHPTITAINARCRITAAVEQTIKFDKYIAVLECPMISLFRIVPLL